MDEYSFGWDENQGGRTGSSVNWIGIGVTIVFIIGFIAFLGFKFFG